jgi:hypothetical protein
MFTLRWRKGNYWWTRQYKLIMALSERGNAHTQVTITVKDPVANIGGLRLIDEYMQQVLEHIQADLVPLPN